MGNNIPAPFRPFVIPGQVPQRRELAELNALTAMPKQRFVLGPSVRPCFSPQRVVEGLGFQLGEEKDWARYVAKAMRAPNELVMRQTLMSRMHEERMEPERRKLIFQRSLSLWRNRLVKSIRVRSAGELLSKNFETKQKQTAERNGPGAPSAHSEQLKLFKSMLDALSDESIEKADPKGGKYVRRVPKPGGGYRYFYDEEKYKQHPGAHVSGQEAMEKQVTQAVANAGKEGCEVKSLKALAKRYGAEAVGGILNRACKNGSMRYQGGRLFAKSERFVVIEPLLKAAGHKYLRRIPTGKTKPRWRYIYNITSKHHGVDTHVGDKVRISSDESKGHFEVTSVDGKSVTVKHDETGKTATMSRDKFHEMFREEHKEDIAKAHARLKQTYEAAAKWGSDKQRLAAQQQLADYERRMFLGEAEVKKPKVEKERPEKKTLSRAAFKHEMQRRRDEHLALSGNTYDIRDKIKAAGGIWDRYDKVWLMPDHRSLEEMRKAIPAKAPKGKPKPSATLRATGAQIEFASNLISKVRDSGNWSKTDASKHGDPPSRRDLASWSRAEVSALIDDLKGVGWHKRPPPATPIARRPASASIPKEQESKAPYKLSGGDGYGCRGWQEGQTMRTSERSRKEHGWPEYITVVTAGSRYYREDGLSFGVGDEEGNAYWATARAATPEEIEPVKTRIEAKEHQVRLQKEVASIKDTIQKPENYPGVSNESTILEGERLFDTQNIYGGGDWFVITDTDVWYVRNNGSDGDNWANNNIRTGGAGAIGWKIPHDGKVENRLREIAKELGAP